MGKHNHLIRSAMARHNTTRLNPIRVHRSPMSKWLEKTAEELRKGSLECEKNPDFVSQIGMALTQWFKDEPFINANYEIQHTSTHKKYGLVVKPSRVPPGYGAFRPVCNIELQNDHVQVYCQRGFGMDGQYVSIPYEDPSMLDILRTTLARFYNGLAE